MRYWVGDNGWAKVKSTVGDTMTAPNLIWRGRPTASFDMLISAAAEPQKGLLRIRYENCSRIMRRKFP